MENVIRGNSAPGEGEEFLTSLAVDRNISVSTQNQAKSALLFFYKAVLSKRARKPAGRGPLNRSHCRGRISFDPL
jgi:hypothetical protein